MKRVGLLFTGLIIVAASFLVNAPSAKALTCKVLDPYYVSQVQRGLANKGFDPGPVDGYMGSKTCTAIVNFQKSRRLAADGIVGVNTGNALGLSRTVSCGSGYNTCFLAVERTGYQGSLYVIRDGSVVKKLTATFGGYGHRTPTGTRSVFRSIAGSHTSTQYPSEEPNMNYPLYFLNGYAIHGSRSVGSASGSHGCVRIGWSASKDIYNNYYRGYGIKTVVVRR